MTKPEKITPAEYERLLQEVTDATNRTNHDLETLERNHKEATDAARKPRQEAVLAAWDAGIHRVDIADAAGISLSRVYQIARGTNK